MAVKLALVAPSATVTEAGTATAESLLVRLAVNPPLSAAMLRVMVHTFVPEPVMDDWAQLSAVSIGMRTPQQRCLKTGLEIGLRRIIVSAEGLAEEAVLDVFVVEVFVVEVFVVGAASLAAAPAFDAAG